ncbi:MAG: phosphatidate cytidylyltransferase [Pseudomonadota bacterium]|nr:phosphatidate cytidylyltransferase [Pseudomonadota bacterium]
MNSGVKVRLMTAFFLVLLFVTFLMMPRPMVMLVLLGLSSLAVDEMSTIFCRLWYRGAVKSIIKVNPEGWRRSKIESCFAIIFGIGVASWGLLMGGEVCFTVLAIGFCAVIWVIYSVSGKNAKKILDSQIGALLTQVTWVCMLSIFLYGVYYFHQENKKMLIWIVVMTSLSDFSGYCVGKLCGGRKVFPELSPNKTTSGTVAMVLIPMVASLLLWRFVKPFGVLYVFSGVGALLGDLWMSQIKRQVCIKDTGALLPGHGGVLDRIDSHMLTMTVALIWFSYMGIGQ